MNDAHVTSPSRKQDHRSDSPSAERPRILFQDRFVDAKDRGAVIGTRATSGARRHGVDRGGNLAIDHGALRIFYPERPGWGQQSIAYGPLTVRPGTAFAVLALNGHNSSQTWAESAGHPNTPIKRAKRFLKGILRRGFTHERVAPFLPASVRAAVQPSCPHRYEWPPLTENFAVGWFPTDAPARSGDMGHAFGIEATGVDNAALTVRVCGQSLPVLRGLQNVPLYLIGVVRESGLVYYVASLSGVVGSASHPMMRPVAVDPTPVADGGFVGVAQSILGEIGFRVDSRVYGVQAAHLPALSEWYTTARLADTFSQEPPVPGTHAEVGTEWMGVPGPFGRTGDDALRYPGETIAWQPVDAAPGLICSTLGDVDRSSPTGIVWRMTDDQRFWIVLVDAGQLRLFIVDGGRWECVASEGIPTGARRTTVLQILDDGTQFQISLNGRMMFGRSIDAPRYASACGVGVYSCGASGPPALRTLEVHPQSVPIPAGIDPGPCRVPRGMSARVWDDFSGRGEALEGRTPTHGGGAWEKNVGTGSIDVTESGAVVHATVDQPNPGRTVYTVPWSESSFADLEVDIVPPGTEQGRGEKGRGGVVFWQDEANYVVVATYLDDWAIGRSISSFFQHGGEEDIHRAVWTNVGDRLHWGDPYTLRVAFDGDTYVVWLDGEPVLYRALTDVFPETDPMVIRRVGIVANWEYGNDTGSRFRSFVARTRTGDGGPA